jgi:subtilisin family serine protease
VDYYASALEYGYNSQYDPRGIVGDNYSNSYETGYGNNDLKGPDPSHGTHVSGIIAGKRGNNIGLDGVADNVEIMVVRVVPDGDERDKDVANGIRYAADNGANIINMSFGKSYSYDKNVVDEAVKYAEKKGVLIIHAAGNDSEDLDGGQNFPTKKFLKGGSAKNWLEIGAMGWQEAPNSVGSFSNYGKKSVDIFAPGVDIYSTYPNNEYKFENGTSMAAPSASGVAAVLMSYFPDLTAAQVKGILMKTAARYPGLMINKPGTEDLVDFTSLSVSGGVINLYAAVMEAMKMSKSK